MQQSSNAVNEKKYKKFKDLIMWQRSQELFEMTTMDIKKWPKNVVSNAIAYQLTSCVGSISANVAEGYGRGGSKEFEQFLRFSRGSLTESENWLYKAMKEGLITESRYDEYLSKMEECSKMIAVFTNRLRRQGRRNAA